MLLLEQLLHQSWHPLLAKDMLLPMYDNADPDELWLMLTIYAGFESVCCKEIICSK